MSVCCKFYLENSCRFGANCRFQHAVEAQPSETNIQQPLPQEATTISPCGVNSLHRPLCRYISTVEGCRYGDLCRFSHDISLFRNGNDHSELKPPVIDFDGAIIDNQKEVKAQEDYTCGICFDKIKTFGLLVGCDHALCIGCINTWRKGASENQSEEHKKSRRSCPLCRQHSDFVIASNVFVQGNAKKDMVDQRLAVRESVLCRDWTLHKKCKFGGFCFYAHRDENGNCVKEQQKREFEERKQRVSSYPRAATARNNHFQHFARMSRIEFQFLVRYMANLMNEDDEGNFDEEDHENDDYSLVYRRDDNHGSYRDQDVDEEYEY